ncbi:Reh1 protein [Martiniozyma asiatica (nom. inval.)]|nr:Reh1 protein [Martiniozyma asiatica]
MNFELPAHTVINKDKFTCLGCQVTFPTQETQRKHMKTEWHRYNLKRRVANLPSVPANVFEQKVAIQKHNQTQVDEFGFLVNKPQKAKGKSHLKLQKDNKLKDALLNNNKFSQPGFFSDHQDQLERDLSPARSEVSTFSLGTVVSSSEYDTDNVSINLTDLGSEVSVSAPVSDDELTDADLTDDEGKYEAEIEIPLDQCFYCGLDQDSIDSNVQHMAKWHGLYIPRMDELVDIEGMLRIVADAVGIEKTCLKCGYSGTKLFGLRQHIKSKGHAVIPYETREQRDFWKPFYRSNVDDGDVDTDINASNSQTVGSDVESSEDEYTHATIDSSGVELILPNGARLGHRSMTRYYKQTITNSNSNRNDIDNDNEGLLNSDDTVVADGDETTLTKVDSKTQEMLRMRQILKEKEEAKTVGRAEQSRRNRELSSNHLKYRNKMEHYRDQYL